MKPTVILIIVAIIISVGTPTASIPRPDESKIQSIAPSKIISSESNELPNNNHDSIVECGTPENLHKGSFTVLDYVVVLGMLIISLGIGVFYGFFSKNKSESSSDFLLGSEMTLFPVTLSLTTSFITAVELLGNPSEMFFNGTQYSLVVISMVLVIPVAVKIFYPIYFDYNLTSCYEYLGIRFGIKLRVFGALLYIIQMSFYTSVAVLAPAIALSKATGLHTHLAVVLIYLVCIFYASQGGMKAVVIADTFQACVLFISLVLVLILGHFYTGDISSIFEIAKERERLEIFNFDPNPTKRHTVFSVIIGGFFYWTSMFCTNQACVQKCMSLRTLNNAKKAIYYSVIGLIVVFLINFYTGLLVFKEYANCEPLRAGEITASDELLPFYVMDVFHDINFLMGIFVAGIFAASLGTVASALSSLAAVTSEDLFVAALGLKICPKKSACYAKWMSLLYGAVSFLLVFLVERLGGVLEATLTLNGLIGGLTLGLFSLGVFFKKANSKGVLIGGAASMIIMIFIGLMSQINNIDTPSLSSSLTECTCFINETREAYTDFQLKLDFDENSLVSPIYRISYMWYSFLSTFITVLLGLICSFVFDIFSPKKEVIITEKPNRKQSMENEKYEIYLIERNIKSSMEGTDNLGLEK